MSAEAASAPVRQAPVLLALAVAGFVTALDNNVVNVALPTVQSELGATVPQLEWIVSGYVLAFASLLIVGGRLADLAGRRRVLLIGLAALIVTSVAAGFAESAEVLIGVRFAQGASAALVMPASLAVLAADIDREHRDLAAGIWTASLAVALALGPVVGGVLTEHLHWSWIFFLHLPTGLATMALVWWGLPDVRPRTGRMPLRRLDPAGLALSTVVLAAGSFALVEGQSLGFGAPLIIGAAAVAVAGVPVLIAVERRVAEPMLRLSLVRNRVFGGGTIAQVLWGVGVNGTLLYTSLFLQDVLELSPSAAGLVFVPLAGLLVLCVPLVPPLSARFGARWIVTTGMALVALGLWLLAQADAQSSVWGLMPGLLSIGVGSALITPLTSAVLSAAPPGTAGVASAMISAAREASGVLGVAVVGVVLSAWSGAALAGGATADAAYTSGYSAGMRMAAGLVLIGAVATAFALAPERSTPKRSANIGQARWSSRSQ